MTLTLGLDYGATMGRWSGGLFSTRATATTFLLEPVEEAWRRPVDLRLERLSRYEHGWDGYDAAPPSSSVIAYARSILQSAMSPRSPAPSIVPMAEGGLQLEWHRGGFDIELAIFTTSDVELSIEYPDNRESIEDKPLSNSHFELSKALEELA